MADSRPVLRRGLCWAAALAVVVLVATVFAARVASWPPALAPISPREPSTHAPAAPPRVDLAFPAEQLELPPEVRELASALGEWGQLEAESVSMGGPSFAYAMFLRVVLLASEDELMSLLKHESPIVRAYVARFVLRHSPARVARLLPLLSDDELVPDQSGCMRGIGTLGGFVLLQACLEVPQSQAAATFLRLALSAESLAPEEREAAAWCLSVADLGPGTWQRALHSLEGAVRARVRRGRTIPAVDHGRTAWLERAARHPCWRMRYYAAARVARHGEGSLPPGHEAILNELSHDPHPFVRSCALRRLDSPLAGCEVPSWRVP